MGKQTRFRVCENLSLEYNEAECKGDSEETQMIVLPDDCPQDSELKDACKGFACSFCKQF